MGTIITHSAGTIAPTLVDGFEAARASRTIVHDILGREDADVTFRPTGLRRGTLRCLFAVQADAIAAEAILTVPQVFGLSDEDAPAVAMSFVVAGDDDVRMLLDDDTRGVWFVEVPFQEVRL